MKRSNSFRRRQALLHWFAVCLLVLLQLQLIPNFSVDGDVKDQSALEANYAQLPLAFEPNQGQVDEQVQYLVHHGQATTYFTGTETVTSVGDEHVKMSLVGAIEPSFSGTEELSSKTNYFVGNDQSKWQSNVPNYQGILAQNVYPGIDLKYYGNNSQLEHDFIVSPGTDPKQIAFNFFGQQDLSLDANGNLVLKLKDTELILQAPISYQDDSGSRKAVKSSFELTENMTVKIALGSYDATRALVIDPVLIYSTYLGGSGDDLARGIIVDAGGNAYVTGQTSSTNFPTSAPFQASNGGGIDVFVTKMNPAGSALVYSTYLGGSGTESNNNIVVDISGNAFITGYTTSTNFPTNSAFQASYGGTQDAYVTKLNAAGSALIYSTYLGGSIFEYGSFVAVDSAGNAYVTGYTTSANFPTSSPFQAVRSGSQDAFVTKLSPSGLSLIYSTYLGGSAATDFGWGIAVDSAGNAYVTGLTTSTNFPTSSPYQASNGGGQDAFATKLNAAGSALTYSTYLGGSGTDGGRNIFVDSSGNAYLDGSTTSTNFPTSSPFQASNGGSQDAFVTKLNAAGSALTYSTYLGGSGDDTAFGFALDSSGNAYLDGSTTSTNFPTSSPYQASNGGGQDAFVTKLNAAGSALTYSTYLGGSGADEGHGVAADLSGNAYVTGYTASTNFPTSSPFQASNGGGAFDAFITKLSEHSVILSAQVNPTLTFTVNSTSCPLGTLSTSQTQFCTYTITAATNATNGYIISYLPAATLTSPAPDTISHLSSQTTSSLGSEQFGFNLRANTAAGAFTATDFGADASGGTGTVAANYNTVNQFKLNTAGETIASATGPTVATIFTIGTIANIASSTEAGAYTTTLTYNIVSGY